MGYKLLGWAVWKAARVYLHRRLGLASRRRRAVLAGAGIAAAGAVAAAGWRATRQH